MPPRRDRVHGIVRTLPALQPELNQRGARRADPRLAGRVKLEQTQDRGGAMTESFALKPISKPGIPRALEKAERYRLLNDPEGAESICLDILALEPDHQQALVVLILALTDQVVRQAATQPIERARECLDRLTDEYERSGFGPPRCGVIDGGWVQSSRWRYSAGLLFTPPGRHSSTRIITLVPIFPPSIRRASPATVPTLRGGLWAAGGTSRRRF